MTEEKEERNRKPSNHGAILHRLRANDILSRPGRPQAADKSRPGNAFFETIILEYSQSYKKAESREQKRTIVNNVLNEISKRNPTGRFVKKLPDERYAVLLEESVMIKVAKELREATLVPQRSKRKRQQEDKPAETALAPKRQNRRNGGFAPVPLEESLGKVAQGLLQLMLTSDSNHIDIDGVAEHFSISETRIHDVIDILDGAGVVERVDKNQYEWMAPILRTPGQFMNVMKTLGREQNVLDRWINILRNSMGEAPSIAIEQLEPLLEKDTALLVVHLPRNSVVRTVHLPRECGKAFVFTLSVPPTEHSVDSFFLPTYLLRKDNQQAPSLSSRPSNIDFYGKENVPNGSHLRKGSVRTCSALHKRLSTRQTTKQSEASKHSLNVPLHDGPFSPHRGRLLHHANVLEERCTAILADAGHDDSEQPKPLDRFEALLRASSLSL